MLCWKKDHFGTDLGGGIQPILSSPWNYHSGRQMDRMRTAKVGVVALPVVAVRDNVVDPGVDPKVGPRVDNAHPTIPIPADQRFPWELAD